MKDTTPSDSLLQARHNQWNTPPTLINEYVRKVTGSTIARSIRVILGLDNEVYDVTADNNQFIVRISHKENPRFYVFLLVLI